MLFVPADSPRKIEKALSSDADAVIIDLEDAVALDAKQEARQILRDVLADSSPSKAVLVRVNSEPELMESDLETVAGLSLTGLVTAKASTELLGIQAEAGFPLLAIVETSRGLQAAAEIAAHPACERIMLGSIDLSAELGIDPFLPGSLDFARAKLVLDSAAAEKAPPIDGVHTDIADLDGLIAESKLAKQHGMGGKACIHPTQIAPVHEVFTPTAEEVAAARELVDAYEAATSNSTGAFVHRGQMVDLAIVRRAQRTLQAVRN